MRGLGLLAGIGLAADLIIKSQIAQLPSGTVLFAWSYFGIEALQNRNIFIWLPIAPKLLAALSIVILLGVAVAMVWNYIRKRHTINGALLFILFGGLSNVVDRIIYGSTIDFLKIGALIGNIADILILVGILLLLRKSKPHAS